MINKKHLECDDVRQSNYLLNKSNKRLLKASVFLFAGSIKANVHCLIKLAGEEKINSLKIQLTASGINTTNSEHLWKKDTGNLYR